MLDGGLSLHGLTGGSEKNGGSQRDNSQLGKAGLRGDGNDGGIGSKEQPATARRNNDMWNQDGAGGPGMRKGEATNNFKAYWSKADRAITREGGAKSADHTEL